MLYSIQLFFNDKNENKNKKMTFCYYKNSYVYIFIYPEKIEKKFFKSSDAIRLNFKQCWMVSLKLLYYNYILNEIKQPKSNCCAVSMSTV